MVYNKIAQFIYFCCIACLLTVRSLGQVIPADGSILHYNQVLFEYPVVKDAACYKLQVSVQLPGNRQEQPYDREHVDSSIVTILENLSYGTNYSWRVFAYDKSGNQIDKSADHSFSTIPSPWNADPILRTRIFKNDTVYHTEGLICIDYMKAAIDWKGNPVWFLTSANKELQTASSIRDLRMTDDGHITFLTERNIYECDLDGNILWTGPNDGQVSGDTSEFYHHCFSKLSNGNYMVLGSKYVFVKIPDQTDTSGYAQNPDLKFMNGEIYRKVEFGTIIEYDSCGKVYWSWDSQNYLHEKDLFYRRKLSDIPNVNAHLNSFDIDEKSGIVYAGFRNLNRVVIIDKKTGNVLNSIGARMPSGEARSGDGFFMMQHDSKLLANGNLAVFNNDVADEGVVSSIVSFTQPQTFYEASHIVWKLNCNFDTLTNGKSPKFGNIESLPNGHYLVCTGSLSRLIEVDDEKNLYWDCFTEVSYDRKVWQPFPTYRANFTSSLYPCYFSLVNVLASDTIQISNGRESTLRFKIVNEGSNADTYSIKVNDHTGQSVKEEEPIHLDAGKSAEVMIKINKREVNKRIIVNAHSTTGRKLSRQLTYIIN
ncbi:MAG: aryl-sulfate sulfotransferase [Chitinophagales bacterium]